MERGGSDRVKRHFAPELPTLVRFRDVLGSDVWSADSLVEAWGAAGSEIAAPVGIGRSGVVELELPAGRGLWGLVTGLPGSGKGQFLRSFIASLAFGYPPDKISLLLVNGGDTEEFEVFANLPHTVEVDALGVDSIIELAAHLFEEVDRREQLCVQLGVKDIRKARCLRPDGAWPDLLVVFDEVAPPAMNQPDVLDRFLRLSERGGRFGLHFVFTTQTPGSMPLWMVSQASVRVAFRLAAGAGSEALLGTSDAENLPMRLPGRGYLRAGDDASRLFQAIYANYVPGFPDPEKSGSPLQRGRPSSARDLAERRLSDLDRLLAVSGEAAQRWVETGAIRATGIVPRG